MSAIPDEVQPRSSKNHAFVDEVAAANVRLALRTILQKSPVLCEMAEKGEIALVGGMYDIETGKVRIYTDLEITLGNKRDLWAVKERTALSRKRSDSGK